MNTKGESEESLSHAYPQTIPTAPAPDPDPDPDPAMIIVNTEVCYKEDFGKS